MESTVPFDTPSPNPSRKREGNLTGFRVPITTAV